MLSRWRQSRAEGVVAAHGPKVYRHLRRIFGPSQDIDDIYQSVFVEVLRSLPSFRGQAQMSTWIRRITWNVAYQEMRLRYGDREDLCENPENQPAVIVGQSTSPSPETLAQNEQMRRRLYGCLNALDPKLRLIVILYDIEGCTLAEIAGIVGRPLQTVASQLRSGRASLAQLMSVAMAEGVLTPPQQATRPGQAKGRS